MWNMKNLAQMDLFYFFVGFINMRIYTVSLHKFE
jgi:hypothetical protein